MYLPILRGKQYELLALRELSSFFAGKTHLISPVIEPVRKSFSTLSLTLTEFKTNNINFNLIVNPIVGDLKGKSEEMVKMINDFLSDYDNFQLAFYINRSDSIELFNTIKDEIEIEFKGFAFIHLSSVDNIDALSTPHSSANHIFNLINSSKTSRRYYRNFKKETRVSLDDNFILLDRNSDYVDVPDELFSEEHLYYEEDGYVGFSDYLTIGEPFATGGFLPYAVVIHFTYKDDKNKIRIRHFVSDSNEDASDVAGKYFEALTKLVKWIRDNNVDTEASRKFINLYERQHFPGLGVLKKLSIMNHLELVLNLLGRS